MIGAFSSLELVTWHLELSPPSVRYTERLQQRITETGSRLCVGLDPRPGEGGAKEARNFLRRVIEENTPYDAGFKPNMSYFEAM